MTTQQTWMINGRSFNRMQLAEFRAEAKARAEALKKGLNAVETQEEVKKVRKSMIDKKKGVKESGVEQKKEAVESSETLKKALEAEFEKLKAEKAWVVPGKKERYSELKQLLNIK
jgi:hypothetical protein